MEIMNQLSCKFIKIGAFMQRITNRGSVEFNSDSDKVINNKNQLKYYLALDLGSGYFKGVLALVDNEGKIVKIFFEDFEVVLMGDAFKSTNNKTIPEETIKKAIAAVQKLVDKAKKIAGDNTLKISGIATEIFRQAGEAGEKLLKDINAIAGDGFIKKITAENEGELGLLTARTAFLERYPNKTPPNISWDSGNMSFQIPYQNSENKIKVLKGPIGSADVQSLYATEILGYDKYDLKKTKYAPVSKAEIEQFLSMILGKLPQPEKELLSTLEQEKFLVSTIGDKDTIFGMTLAAMGKTSCSIEDVKKFLNSLADREELGEDLQVIYGSWAPFIVPRTALLYAVMNKYGIDTFEHFTTLGCTKGLLLIPELWK